MKTTVKHWDLRWNLHTHYGYVLFIQNDFRSLSKWKCQWTFTRKYDNLLKMQYPDVLKAIFNFHLTFRLILTYVTEIPSGIVFMNFNRHIKT